MSFNIPKIFPVSKGFALVILLALCSASLALAQQSKPIVQVDLQSVESNTNVVQKGDINVHFADLSLTAPADKDVQITRILLKQIGSVDSGGIERIRLMSTDKTVNLGPQNLEGGIVSFEEIVTITKGTTKTFEVVFQVGSRAQVASTLQFEIFSYTVLTGRTMSGEDVAFSGNFPLRTDILTISASGVENFVHVVQPEQVSSTVAPNTKKVALATLDITAHGTGAARLSRITFQKSGTAASQHFTNFILHDSGGNMLAGPEAIVDGNVDFTDRIDLSRGISKKIILAADIDRDVPANSNIYFEVAQSGIDARLQSNNNAIEVVGNFPLRIPLKNIVTSQFQIKLSSDTPLSQAMQSGTNQEELARFTVNNSGKQAAWSRLVLTKTGTLDAAFVQNITLVDSGGNELVTPKNMSGDKVVFSNIIPLADGENAEISLRADIAAAAPAGETIGFQISTAADVQAQAVENAETIMVNAALPLKSNLMTISSGNSTSLRVALEPYDAAVKTLVNDSENAGLTKILLTAQGENVELNTLTMRVNESDVDILENVRLYDIYGNIVATAQMERNVLFFSTRLGIAEGETETLYVLADIDSDSGGGDIALTINAPRDISAQGVQSGSGAGVSGSFPLQSQTLQITTIDTANMLEVSILPQPILRSGVVRNATDLVLGELILTTGDTPVAIEQLIFKQVGSIKNAFEEIRLVNEDGKTIGASESIESGIAVLKEIDELEANTTYIFTIEADIDVLDEGDIVGFSIATKGLFTFPKMAPVIKANFPMRTSMVQLESFAKLFCDDESAPVCGWQYSTCEMFPCEPEEITYANMCWLREAEAFLIAETDCSNKPARQSTQPPITASPDPTTEPTTTPTADQSVNRAIALKMILSTRYGEMTDIPQVQRYIDVSTSEWFAPYVYTALQQGIISMPAERIFRPGDQITRGEILKLVTLAFGLKRNLPFIYADVDGDSWVAEYAGLAYAQNLFPSARNRLLPTLAVSKSDITNVLNNISNAAKLSDAPEGFPDVDPESLEGAAALELLQQGIINGFPPYGEFRGIKEVNRAEAAKMLLLACCGEPNVNATVQRFSDVATGAWYAVYVEDAARKGVINGFGDGTFRAAEGVTAAQFLKMLAEAFGAEKNLPFRYFDVAANDWFAPYAGLAYEYDLFPNRREIFLDPHQPLDRNEFAVALYRYLEAAQ